jgi:hypothetical protein
MKAVIIDVSARHEWEDFIQRNPHSIAWQSYEWSEVLKKHYALDFHPIAAYDDGKIGGLLPLYGMKTRSSNGSLISVPYAVAGGIVADCPEACDCLLSKAVEMSQAFDSCPITLKQYKIEIPGPLTVDRSYYNRELDLVAGIESIWNGLNDANKEAIEGVEKKHTLLVYPSSDSRAFYDMLLAYHHAKGVPCVSRRWIEDLVAFKMYSIALLRLGQDVVAGTMVKEFKSTVSFPFTCARGLTEKDTEYVYSLYWQLINYFSAQGKEILHSGRIPNSNQTDAYRLGWGGIKHNYYYQYYPQREQAATEFALRRNPKRALFERCWRKLPRSAARFLGPYVVKRFP